MLKLRVIPCLDVKDGRVVKGVNFVALRDAGDPVEQAALYDAAGADELCFLDITASHENRDTILDVVSRTASRVFLPLTVGGGIRSTEDMRRLLLAGTDKCSINSAAVARPELVREAAQKFGSQCVVVAVDAKRSSPGQSASGRWEVFTHGGRNGTGIDTVAWCRQVAELGAGEEEAAHVLDRAYAAADGQRQEDSGGGAGDHVEDGVAVLVAGGDVEEAEFVGAGGVVQRGLLDRVAGIAQGDEVDALDDATVLYVQAGDDAQLQHGVNLTVVVRERGKRLARKAGTRDRNATDRSSICPDMVSFRRKTVPARRQGRCGRRTGRGR